MPPAPGPTAFHDVVSKDHPIYKPEKNRYILYVSYACPWASRVTLARTLKKLEDIVPVYAVDPVSCTGDDGTWRFNPDICEDPVMKAHYLREIYLDTCPDYAGRFTVPVLYDTKTRKIVNNESAEILRIFNSGFNELIPGKKIDLYPADLRSQIDDLNSWILPNINSGVYKTGQAKSQQEYETNCKALFDALDRVEGILTNNRFLAGSKFTEADVRLFTTVVRFASVYECHFKCNLKSLRNDLDYPHLLKWLKTVYQMPGVAETVKQDHIMRHFFICQKAINPSSLVPLYRGPDLSTPAYPSSADDFVWID